jgi:hypothetical protein
MKHNCEVVRDLLPLYHDGVCSQESRMMVEEHLKECEACKEELEEIKKEVSVPNASMKDAAQAWKTLVRNLWLRRIAATVLVAVLTVAAVIAGIEIYKWDQKRTIWMGADELECAAYRLADGRVYLEFNGKEHKITVTESPNDPAESGGHSYILRMGYNKATTDVEIPHPERWGVINGNYEQVELDGTGKDDITVICRMDDILPSATEEMEKRVAEYDALMERSSG